MDLKSIKKFLEDTRVNSGASYCLETGKPINKKDGYMVSFMDLLMINLNLAPEDDELLSLIDNLVTKKINVIQGDYLGGWIDDDKLYLDLSGYVQDEKYALHIAKKLNQKAIYDIKNKKNIYLKREE